MIIKRANTMEDNYNSYHMHDKQMSAVWLGCVHYDEQTECCHICKRKYND